MATETLSTAESEVLVAAAGDARDLEHIYQYARIIRPTLPLSDVADAVRSLVGRGLLAPRLDPDGTPPATDDASFVWKARFEATPQGKDLLAETLPPRKSQFGIWKEYNIDLKLEDLAEVRREMWKNFPRDLPE